jgi:hypothetical protein
MSGDVLEVAVEQQIVIEAEPSVVSVASVESLLVQNTAIEVVEVGIQGPPGPGGGGSGSAFTFTQGSPAATWVVNHNLGYRPVTDVTSLGGAQVWAEVLHTSLNQLNVYFDSPTAGQVTCA